MIIRAGIVILAVVLAGSLVGCAEQQSASNGSWSASPVESVVSSADAEIPILAEEAATSLLSEPDVPETNNDWEIDTPENHGMNGALLAQLHTALELTPIRSVVTVKDGYIIDEYYREGDNVSTVYTFNSSTKSFTGALIGLAIDQGFIGGVDDKLADYLPQMAAYADDSLKRDITIGHLLTHTTGIEWHEWGNNYSSGQGLGEAENWTDYVLSRPMVAAPGTYFAYTTGGSHLLSAVLQEATGKTALEYGWEYVFGPMGMDSVVWDSAPEGVIDGGNGIDMTSRDAAKFGQLYLDGGMWRGCRIIPASWVTASTERWVEGADNAAAYGYQWWVRDCGGYETFYAMGAGGQFIFVVPELDLVTVTTSHRSPDTYLPRTYFIDYILGAVK